MKFMPGQIVATPGALELLDTHSESPITFISRHLAGDWGDVCAEDKQANESALKNGARILSSYKLGKDKLWIITEACDDRGIREATTLLLPHEY